MKTNHFTAGCFTEKFHENPSIPPQHWWLRGTLFHLDRCQLLPSPEEFYPGSFCRNFCRAKPSPTPSKHWKLQQTFDRFCFSKRNAAADFGMGVFFWSPWFPEPFGSVFISKNQWDPMATSSWSFDPATSCGQLALEYYIYIYILLGIGSITLSHEFPRLLNPTTPGIVIRFPQCHNIGNLMLGQVCGLLSDPISPELSFGQWQCIHFRVYLYVSNYQT